MQMESYFYHSNYRNLSLIPPELRPEYLAKQD